VKPAAQCPYFSAATPQSAVFLESFSFSFFFQTVEGDGNSDTFSPPIDEAAPTEGTLCRKSLPGSGAPPVESRSRNSFPACFDSRISFPRHEGVNLAHTFSSDSAPLSWLFPLVFQNLAGQMNWYPPKHPLERGRFVFFNTNPTSPLALPPLTAEKRFPHIPT